MLEPPGSLTPQHFATMGVTSILKHIFVPTNKKAQDGRDQWPSRTSFILAAMGGCVGLGNILRYRQSPALVPLPQR